LIVSLLVIPAAAARQFASTPEQMAILAAAVGALAVTSGIAASMLWDVPAGPSIVLAAAAVFLVSLAAGSLLPLRPRDRPGL
jgi:zinc transport system permease protein